jgi:hypothetical protein
MLTSPITATYDSESISLNRINQDNYSAEYFGQTAAGTERITLKVAHTIPKRGGDQESHLVRVDVEHFDAEGVYSHTSSAWDVIKTFDGVQVAADSILAYDLLVDILDSSTIAAVVGRQS